MTDPIEVRVHHAVEAALDRKAFDVDVLQVNELTSIADYFIICSGNSERQTQAIADAIEDKLRQSDRARPRLTEGMTPGRWILLDYGDFVIHIFTEECRAFYRIERLWADAPNVTNRFVQEQPAAAAK